VIFNVCFIIYIPKQFLYILIMIRYLKRNVQIMRLFQINIFILLCLVNETSLHLNSTKQTEQKGELRIDSIENCYRKIAPLNLPLIRQDSINPLFNQCNYCQKENRRWYSSVNELCEAASICGYDFIQIRFDQMFFGSSDVRQDVSTALFVMIYASATAGSFTIDSVIYIQRNKTSSKKTAFYSPVSRKKTGNIDLSGENKPKNTESIDCRRIRELTSFSGNFRSLAEYSEKYDKFKYLFSLGDSVYCITEKEFQTESMDYMAKKKDWDSPVRTYYRLGIFSDFVNCFEKKKLRKPGTIKINLIDHYVFNQCILHYEIESEIGIKSIKLNSGSLINKEIKFAGDKKLSGSIPVGFGSKRTRLYVSITDMDGNVIDKSVEIFSRVDEEWKKHEQLEELKDAREAWGNQNGFTKVVSFAGKFEGSIISKLIDIYCDGQAQKYLLLIPDKYSRDSVKEVSLPVQGRAVINGSLFQSVPALYTYECSVYAKRLELYGTSVTLLSNPSLILSDELKKMSIRYELPVGNGYYISKCNVNGSGSIKKQTNSAVVICSHADYVNDEIQLSGIPFVIPQPSASIGYSLLVQYNIESADSLLLTYVIEHLDRTKVVLYRWIDCGKKSFEKGSDAIQDNETEIRFKEKCSFSGQKEITVISQDEITSGKEILGVNVFVYSEQKNSTIGAAGFSVRDY
jgi:hypothetical protein